MDVVGALLSFGKLLGVIRAVGAPDFGGLLSRQEEELLALDSVAPSRDELRNLSADIVAGLDPLGEASLALRDTRSRRTLGAFYTPKEIVTAITGWALAREPARLIDAGCGSGRFALQALAMRPETSVTAIDIDPLATLVTRTNMLTRGVDRSARVINGDYLQVSFPEACGRTAFVGNPPYVRHHGLTKEQKAWGTAAARTLGLKFPGLSGLHSYFFLATALKATEGDVGCFVTSAEWLDVRYGGLVRHLLTNGLGLESIHMIDANARPFADAMTTAVVSCFRVGATSTEVHTQTISGAGCLDLSNAEPVSRALFVERPRWSSLIKGVGDKVIHEGMIRLGDIARVHRGVVTGSNKFFVMPRAEAHSLGLAKYVKPVIHSAREVLESEGSIVDTTERWVLLDPPPLDLSDPVNSALRRYVEGGEKGVAGGYICSHRRPWWKVGAKPPPPIVATYMARQPPMFALNRDGLAILNVLHGIYPLSPMPPARLADLVSYLNQNRSSFRGLGRTYAGGLEKFEPSELESIPVPSSLID